MQEESYTTQASFLDLDPMPVYNTQREEEAVFRGKRVKRGLYRASDGHCINADVNETYNILRKRRPDAFLQAKGGLYLI